MTETEESTRGLKELGLFSSIVGHLGDGNFHEAIMYHKSGPMESAAVAAHVKKMIGLALEKEGTSTVNYTLNGGTLERLTRCRANIQLGISRRRSCYRKLDQILWQS